jgi:hypothetical protein
VWEDVPQNREPPDWFLTINKTRYAVEATTIEDFLIITPTSKLSAANVSATLFAFIKDIERAAIDQGILSGTYNITICPIPNFARNRQIFLDKFLCYIRQTQSLPYAEEYSLGYVRHEQVTIQKIHNKENRVMGGLLLGGRWEEEAQKDLLELVSKALVEKVYKLRSVSESKILLLLDDYHFSFMADWIKLISTCPERFHFCCISRIAPPDGSVIIWANSPEWKAITTE